MQIHGNLYVRCLVPVWFPAVLTGRKLSLVVWYIEPSVLLLWDIFNHEKLPVCTRLNLRKFVSLQTLRLRSFSSRQPPARKPSWSPTDTADTETPTHEAHRKQETHHRSSADTKPNVCAAQTQEITSIYCYNNNRTSVLVHLSRHSSIDNDFRNCCTVKLLFLIKLTLWLVVWSWRQQDAPSHCSYT